MMNYRPLTFTNSGNDFIDETTTLLREFEQHIAFVYDDRVVNSNNPARSHNPTMGDGINLRPVNDAGRVLEKHLALVLDQ